jgi:hypothetical protein
MFVASFVEKARVEGESELQVVDILAGSYCELTRHFSGARGERSQPFPASYLHILRRALQ